MNAVGCEQQSVVERIRGRSVF